MHTSKLRINLLICDQFPGILPPDIPSYEWMFMQVFSAACPTAAFSVFQAWRGELPETVNRGEVYLISGSNADSYGDVQWVVALREWIKAAYASGALLAGICFGHQIIAEALGGRAARSAKGWGIGVRRSVMKDDASIRLLGADHYALIYDHHDQVMRMPAGATLVSGSAFCPVESFRIGRQVVTLQGHPEFTVPFISHWIRDCAPTEQAAVKAAALTTLAHYENEGVRMARWMIDMLCPAER